MFLSLRERTQESCSRYLVVTQVVLRRWPQPFNNWGADSFQRRLRDLPAALAGRTLRSNQAPQSAGGHRQSL